MNVETPISDGIDLSLATLEKTVKPEIPRYRLHTAVSKYYTESDKWNDEYEHIKIAFGNGVKSSLTRLDKLPLNMKHGAVRESRKHHQDMNIKQLMKQEFNIKSRSRLDIVTYPFYSNNDPINGSDRIKAIETLPQARKSFTGSSNSRSINQDHSNRNSRQSSRGNLSKDVDRAGSKDFLRTNVINVNQSSGRHLGNESFRYLYDARYRPDMTMRQSNSISDEVWISYKARTSSTSSRQPHDNTNSLNETNIERDHDHSHGLGNIVSGSADHVQKLSSRGGDCRPMTAFNKSDWIDSTNYNTMILKKFNLLHVQLQKDWLHNESVEVTLNDQQEYVVAFDLEKSMSTHEAILRYMNALARHGLASELDLKRKYDRWNHIERRPRYSQDNDHDSDPSPRTRPCRYDFMNEHKEFVIFVFILPWNTCDIRLASADASRQSIARIRRKEALDAADSF